MGEKHFRVKKFLGQKHFGSKTFSGQTIFGSKTFSDQKIFGSKKYSGQKVFGSKKFSGQKNFRVKIIFVEAAAAPNPDMIAMTRLIEEGVPEDKTLWPEKLKEYHQVSRVRSTIQSEGGSASLTQVRG